MTGTSGLRTERITLDLQTYYYAMNCPMNFFLCPDKFSKCPNKNDIGQTFDLANENCYFQLWTPTPFLEFCRSSPKLELKHQNFGFYKLIECIIKKSHGVKQNAKICAIDETECNET